MKVVIEGFYGHGNLGDEAILAALLRWARGTPGMRPVVLSTKPERVHALHAVRSAHSRRPLPSRRLFEIATSRMFLLGGGGVVKDYGEDPSSLARWLSNLELAQRLRRATALACVGVENIRFEKSRQRLVEALHGVDDVTVRDNMSRDLLVELGVTRTVHVAADPAVLLVHPRDSKSLSDERPLQVLVAVRNWYVRGFFVEDESAFDDALRSIAVVADSLIEERRAAVEFVPLRTTPHDNDVEVARRIERYMRHGQQTSVIQTTPSVEGLLQMIASCDLLIGMRLHATILAAAHGIPMVALSYMPKVRGFMSDIGQERFCLPIEELTPESLMTCVDDTLSCYEHRSAAIVASVDRQRRSVRDAFDRWLAIAGTARPE